MGCDSAVSGENVTLTSSCKITFLDIPFRGKVERMMVGTSGALRILNLVQIFDPPPRTGAVEKYLIGEFSRCFTSFLEENGALELNNNATRANFASLIGHNGEIYSWSVDMGIMKCAEGFEVEGSGSPARAVLWALKDLRLPAEEKLRRTLEYAATYCSGVRPPYKIFCLD